MNNRKDIEMNKLYFGDNLYVLDEYVEDEMVDLIYLDPPFNSKRNYNMPHKCGEQERAFDDIWTWDLTEDRLLGDLMRKQVDIKMAEVMEALFKLLGPGNMMAYLVNMATRLIEMRRVLKHTGSIYLHCDPTSSHYLKLIMDVVFGEENFINEIVWSYTGAQVARKYFPKKHDILLWYGKSKNYTFNGDAVSEGHSEAQLKRYNIIDEDGNRWANMKGKMRQLPPAGRRPTDVWQMDFLTNNDKERLGYPTQKPVALLERIIKASSNPGDVILDPFCGCGTTLEACVKIGNRRWIGIDIAKIAIDVIDERLKKLGVNNYDIGGVPESVEQARFQWEQSARDFKRWAVKQYGGIVLARKVEGYDGEILFNGKNGKERIVIKVEGEVITPKIARDFRDVILREKAAMGVLIAFEEPKEIIKEDIVDAVGRYQERYPKMQVVTVENLIDRNYHHNHPAI